MKSFQSRWLASGALFAALSFSLVAAAKLSTTGTPSAGFNASGPGGINITGKTSDLKVADDGKILTITVGLTSLDTGMELRNKHTKEAIETDKFPTAELTVARGDLKFPAAGAESTGDAKGKLKIHGQTKDVSFHYTAKLDGDTLAIKGSSKVDMTDFGIKTPSYLGVGVKPGIELTVNFHAKDN
jgi:polyisoprenoid-binding protein YceI